MEDKEISIIIFGKPKAFEIYELFGNGTIKNIETENKGPKFLPISTSNNIYHFYKEKGYYYYEVYSEAFANNASRAGNLIGFCIKSKNKININTRFINNIIDSNFQDIKNNSLENNTFIYSNLLNDFINRVKIEKFVSDIVLKINFSVTQPKSSKIIGTQLVEYGNTAINDIQLDLDQYEYYFSKDDRIFRHSINAKEFVELSEQIFVIENDEIVPQKARIVDLEPYNYFPNNSTYNQIINAESRTDRKKLVDLLWKKDQKIKKIMTTCISIAFVCVVIAIWCFYLYKENTTQSNTIAKQDTKITDLNTTRQQLENEKLKLTQEKNQLDTDIENKQQELKNLERQATGTEAELRKELGAVNQNLTTVTEDFNNYKKTSISNTDLSKLYIPVSDIDKKGKYFSQDYINNNYVSNNEYKKLREENDKLKTENAELKKSTNNVPRQSSVNSNVSTNEIVINITNSRYREPISIAIPNFLQFVTVPSNFNKNDIQWTADPQIVTFDDGGISVTQDRRTNENQQVTITGTITKNGRTITGSCIITVKAK